MKTQQFFFANLRLISLHSSGTRAWAKPPFVQNNFSLFSLSLSSLYTTGCINWLIPTVFFRPLNTPAQSLDLPKLVKPRLLERITPQALQSPPPPITPQACQPRSPLSTSKSGVSSASIGFCHWSASCPCIYRGWPQTQRAPLLPSFIIWSGHYFQSSLPPLWSSILKLLRVKYAREYPNWTQIQVLNSIHSIFREINQHAAIDRRLDNGNAFMHSCLLTSFGVGVGGGQCSAMYVMWLFVQFYRFDDIKQIKVDTRRQQKSYFIL